MSIKFRLKKKPSKQYENIISYIDNKEGIRDITKKNYRNMFEKIREMFGFNEGEFDVTEITKQKDNVIAYFSDYNKTKDNQLKFILMIYKMLDRKIPDFFTNIKTESNGQEQQVSLQKASKKLDAEDFSIVRQIFDDYKIHINELIKNKKCKKKNIMEFIALAFYNLLPPFRSNDLIDLGIVEKNPEDDINYLNTKTGKLFYTTYKTSGTYGDIELDIPEELNDILKRFYSTFNIINNYRYIFTTETGKLMSSQNFSKFIKGIKGLNLTPNDLRNLYVSSLKNVSMEERARIAKYMKHALSSQLLIYNKYNKDNF